MTEQLYKTTRTTTTEYSDTEKILKVVEVEVIEPVIQHGHGAIPEPFSPTQPAFPTPGDPLDPTDLRPRYPYPTLPGTVYSTGSIYVSTDDNKYTLTNDTEPEPLGGGAGGIKYPEYLKPSVNVYLETPNPQEDVDTLAKRISDTIVKKSGKYVW